MKTKPSQLKAVREWKARNIDKVKLTKRRCKLRERYNLTLEQYNQMLMAQNHCCKICLKNEKEFTKSLYIDHCHKTNKIRGLLCNDCNRGLGMFKDDIERFKKAIHYLTDIY